MDLPSLSDDLVIFKMMANNKKFSKHFNNKKSKVTFDLITNLKLVVKFSNSNKLTNKLPNKPVGRCDKPGQPIPK